MQCFITYCNLLLHTIIYCMYGARVYMVQHTIVLLYEVLNWFPFLVLSLLYKNIVLDIRLNWVL